MAVLVRSGRASIPPLRALGTLIKYELGIA